MRERPVLHRRRKLVLLIRPRLACPHHLDPTLRSSLGLTFAILPRNRLDSHTLGEISSEMRRVHDQPLHKPGCAQADDSPVHMALFARALRLPPVAHVFAPAGKDEVVLCAKVLVTTGHSDAAILRGGKVKYHSSIRGKDGHGVAKEAETSDAAIGVHVETDVRVALRGWGGEFPAEALGGPAFLDAEDAFPLSLGALPGEDFVVAVGTEDALDGDVWCVVAAEEGGIDLDACYGA